MRVSTWSQIYSQNIKVENNRNITCTWTTISFNGMELEIRQWGCMVDTINVYGTWSIKITSPTHLQKKLKACWLSSNCLHICWWIHANVFAWKTKKKNALNAFLSSQTLHLQKLLWGLLKDFTLPKESFDYAQLDKEVPFH
jgi:hypothetical protein